MPQIVIPAVIAIASGVASHQMAKKGQQQAKEIAEENAAMAQAEAAETARRESMMQAQKRGQLQARIAASGVLGGGKDTAGALSMNMEKEQGRQMAWMKKAGAGSVAAERAKGRSAAGAISRQNWSSWANVAQSAPVVDAVKKVVT
tara:strand:- start:16 stop:453 length:438 start_codon:yes stop_codon:yes gene_type:complete